MTLGNSLYILKIIVYLKCISLFITLSNNKSFMIYLIFSTKEIKPSGPFMRRMYKKVNKNNILPPKASSAISQSSWSSHGSYGNHHSSSGSLTSHNGVSSHNGSSAFSNNQSVPSPQTFPGFSQSANNGRRGPANEPLRLVIVFIFVYSQNVCVCGGGAGLMFAFRVL